MLLVTLVRFNQSLYRINEDGGLIRPTLVLSNPSASDITVEVFGIDVTAGEHSGILIDVYKYFMW